MPKRQTISIPGLDHGPHPIPYAVKIGNLLFTGSIDGRIPGSGERPATPEAQIEQAFKNLRLIVELAGGSLADVAKVDVRLSDLALREVVNRHWVELFPSKEDSPVRHTQRAELAQGTVIQMEVTAHLD